MVKVQQEALPLPVEEWEAQRKVGWDLQQRVAEWDLLKSNRLRHLVLK